jgi:hypothetical protein
MKKNNPKGFALIYLIFIMMALGGMGAAIYSFTTSSSYTELTENNRNRAYQLAQAGMNYAANCYTGNDPSCSPVLTNLHNRTFTLNNNRGQFSFTATKVTPATGTAYYDVTSFGTVNGNDGLLLARAQVRSSSNPNTSDPNNPNFFPAEPPVNQPIANTTFQNLDAFKPTSLKDAANHTKISIQGYVATGGSHLYWAAFTDLGTYPVPDADNPGCNMGFHVGQLADNLIQPIRQSWTDYNHVNYDVQVKVGWYVGLEAAVSGINFRWHEVVSGKYEGYGLSFLRYTYSAAGCGGGYDFIPNSIKPAGLANHLLLILWEQRVEGGEEHRRWLAYADMGIPNVNPALRSGNDLKVIGAQIASVDGLVSDNTLIVVRVKDKFVQGDRVNEINILYGDASPDNSQTTPNSVCTDIARKKMPPQWVNNALFPSWPANKLGLFNFIDGGSVAHHLLNFWVPDPATTTNPNYYDFFTLTSCSTQIGPEPPGTTPNLNPVRLILNPAYADPSSDPNVNPVNKDLVKLLRQNAGQWYDEGTLRTFKFVLNNFSAQGPELGLHGMGNLNNSNRVIAFDDWALQILGHKEK